jgi:hypothetical protein
LTIPIRASGEPRFLSIPIACAAGVGLLLALFVLPVGFIAGTGPAWTRPWSDLNAYVITWEYFVRDEWRFPLLDIPAMSYPEGGSVLLTDALPIGQLASKALYSVAGIKVNPFGWWVLLCYVVQGAMAARLAVAAGARSAYAGISAAIVATTSLAFVGRAVHVAVASHFLILWVMALYLEDVRARRLSALEHCALSSLTLLVNPYLFVMVACVQAATFATLWKDRALSRREWTAAILMATVVVAVGLLEGYGEILAGRGNLRAEGFGVFSWNPLSLVAPPADYWGVHGLVRDTTNGQFEGESYLGLGGLLLLVASLILVLRQMVLALRRHWLFVLVLAGTAAFAAAPRVFVGSYLLLDLQLPPWATDIGSLFRANGRFIWILAYALAVFPLALLLKFGPQLVVIPLVAVACACQLWEVRVTRNRIRLHVATAASEMLDTVQLDRWLSGHSRIFQYPSWACGGFWLAGPAEDRTANTYRELQIDLFAARRGIPINSAYTSRHIKDCTAEKQWTLEASMHGGVLYLINKHYIGHTPRLFALAGSEYCVDAGWGLVCSWTKLEKPSSPHH